MRVTQQRAQQAVNRAQRRALRQQSYHALNSLFHVNSGDFVAFLKTAAKWTALGYLSDFTRLGHTVPPRSQLAALFATTSRAGRRLDLCSFWRRSGAW
jgi:hypothetical protein